MSSLLNKVKEKVKGEKNTPSAATANKGDNEYGTSSNPSGSESSGLAGVGSGMAGASGAGSGTGGTSGIDSDLAGANTTTSGPGSSANTGTTGYDNSAGVGGNGPTTVDSSYDGAGGLDAATSKPSEFAERHGSPEIMHDDLSHNRAGRHGSKVGEDLAKYGGGHE